MSQLTLLHCITKQEGTIILPKLLTLNYLNTRFRKELGSISV
uniref:Uncharacterized protein n=1 Tax=Rhizophora mucronata TaxID=61149 RepID=A0A2P2QBU0_RHIMU